MASDDGASKVKWKTGRG